jgi:hypothetical protein
VDQTAIKAARKKIAENGKRIARKIVASKGIAVSKSAAPEETAKALEFEASRFIENKNVPAAGACFLLIRGLELEFRSNIDTNMAPAAKYLAHLADRLFYDRGDSESAADLLMLAAAMDIANPQIIWETIAPLLQGSRQRAEEALPYTIVTAELDPKRDEVDYILGLTLASEARGASRLGILTGMNWTTAGGNERRTGSCAASFQAPLEIAWKFDQAGFIQGGIAVSDGIAVFGDRRGILFAVNVEEGTKWWESEAGGIMAGTPAIAEGRVYIGRGNMARCFDLRTGEPVWMWNGTDREEQCIGKMFASSNSVLVLGRFVIFCDDSFAILKSETGEPVYFRRLVYDGWSHTGACHNGKNIFLPTGHRLRTFSLVRGASRATIEAEGKVTSGPIAFEDRIVYGNNRGSIVAHDAASRARIWSFSMEGKMRHAMDSMVTSRPA